MKTISVKVNERLDAKLASLAKQRGVSKSDVIREALERATDAPDPSDQRPRPSAHDLMKDLCGIVEGPGDLSYNPKYMEDFGK